MARIRWLGIVWPALLSLSAAAGELPGTPLFANTSYFVCIATPAPYGKLHYASRVFEDRSRMGQSVIQDAFRRYLVQKYSYPEKQGRVQCPAGPTTNAAEQVKLDRVSQMAVVETDWSPSE